MYPIWGHHIAMQGSSFRGVKPGFVCTHLDSHLFNVVAALQCIEGHVEVATTSTIHSVRIVCTTGVLTVCQRDCVPDAAGCHILSEAVFAPPKRASQ